MAGNKNSGRPGGNPDLVQIAKTKSTGPITKEGKRRSASNLPNAFTTGKYSTLLQLQRAGGCDKCSLGIVVKKKTINGKEMEIKSGPICKYYKAGSKKCTLPLEDQAFYMKNYEAIFQDGGEEHALKVLVLDLLKDGKNAEVMEILEKGRSGFYSLEFKKAAGSLLETLLRTNSTIKTENKNLNINLGSEDFVNMSDILGDED